MPILTFRSTLACPALVGMRWPQVLHSCNATRPTLICFSSNGPDRGTGYVAIRLINSPPLQTSHAVGFVGFAFPGTEPKYSSRSADCDYMPMRKNTFSNVGSFTNWVRSKRSRTAIFRLNISYAAGRAVEREHSFGATISRHPRQSGVA